MSKSISLSQPFLRLYVITFLFFSANPIINIVVPLRSEAEGASNAEIGMMMGAYMVTSMLCRPWAGGVVSRFGPLFVLRALLIANGVILLLYTIVGLEWYFAVRAMQGVMTALFSLALQMGLVDTLPENERSHGISLYLLAGMLPAVVGPLAALSIWNWGGMSAFTMTMIFIGIATGLIGYNVRLSPGVTKIQAEKQEGNMLAHLRQLWRNHAFFVCSVAMLIPSISFGAVVTFIVLYTKASGVGNPGLYLMLQAGVIVLSRYTLRKRVPSDGKWPDKLVAVLLLFVATGTLLLGLASNFGAVFMYAASMMLGVGMALLYPTLMTYLTFVLPTSSRNTLIGLFIAVSDFGVLIGNMVMGYVADQLSYTSMYFVCACLTVVAFIIVFVSGRRLVSTNHSYAVT